MAKCKLTAAQRKELQSLFDVYDAARAALHDNLETLANEWQDEYDEASERWQEGDGGQEAQERIDALNELVGNFEEPADFNIEDI